MNHYFLETSAKEKLHNLRAEGMTNQAVRRAGLLGPGFLSRLQQHLVGLLSRKSKRPPWPEVTPEVRPLQVKPHA